MNLPAQQRENFMAVTSIGGPVAPRNADRLNMAATGAYRDAHMRSFASGPRDTDLDASPESPAACKRGRILIVDDNDSVRETLADLLEIDGFWAAQAANAAQAMTLMRREARFDVLLTDLSMPGVDGITLIQQARQIQPELPAILLTGYAERVTTITLGAGGSFRVLQKPVQGDHLVEQIVALIKQPAAA
jgi:CheY-like chemotaxis protein